MKNKTIAIIGNPNCGKTVIFNELTGSRQKVGNWAGVTVEKKTGQINLEQEIITLVDLPGTYSLSVVSNTSGLDEKIACEFLLANQVDAVINVIDASNLERQLYLTLQLLEMRVPMIIALNMMDIAKRRGMTLDINELSKQLGCPVVPLIASQGKGLQALRETLVTEVQLAPRIQYDLPKQINLGLKTLKKHLTNSNQQSLHIDKLWLALRLIEGDQLANQMVNDAMHSPAEQLRTAIKSQLDEEPDLIIADARYRKINDLLQKVYKTHTQTKSFTTMLDNIVLNRFFGIPLFLGVMYLLFLFAINVGGAFQPLFDISSTAIFIHGVNDLLQLWHFPNWLIAVIANGFGKGINTTITFIPVIGAMFLFLSLLEDSGYMARAAFVVDKLMGAVGLPGKAFVPLIVGFGCNVPTVMATRTLATQRDRILTIMMAPFMSCGARLTVYVLFVAAFFPQHGALIIFSLYFIGIITAILTALLLGATQLKAESTPMILELPHYHWPHWKSVLLNTWQRLKLFLVKAGRFIIPICMLLGFLNAISPQGKLISGEANQSSLLSSVGKTLTPLFAPMGIQQANWPATVGIAGGLLAKEVVVGTLNTLYSQVGQLNLTEEKTMITAELKEALVSVPNNLMALGGSLFNPLADKMGPPETTPGVYGVMSHYFDNKLSAYAYLLFILLYFPCVSTMAAMQREIGKYWTFFSMLWSTGIAYAVATIFYQTATFSQHPFSSSCIFLIIISILTVTFLYLRFYSKNSNVKPFNTGKSEFTKEACHG